MPRQMRCPRCKTINTVEDGAAPVCRACGFGAPPGTPPPGGPPGADGPPPGFPDGTLAAPAAAPAQRPGGGLRWAAVGAYAVAILMLAFVQLPFAAWSSGTMEASGPEGGFNSTLAYGAWSIRSEGPDDEETDTYWNTTQTESGEDIGGIWLLRMGGPALALAATLALAAGILLAVGRPGVANALGWSGFSLGATGVVLLAMGIWQNQGWLEDYFSAVAPAGMALTATFAWSVGFYLAIAAVLAAAAGSFLGSLRPARAAS